MTNNSLPPELLEKIFKTTYEGTYYRWYYLQKYALVCQKWAVVANSFLWGEVDLYNRYNVK
ncbi:11423_t:CDS:1, partial [Rhizophagus irregularis]